MQGRSSNRDAVGAKVVVVAGDRRYVAYRSEGGSYQSASDPRLHFGLGTAERINMLKIVWPSGRVDCHRDLRPDTGYLVCEGDELPKPLTGFPREVHPREGKGAYGSTRAFDVASMPPGGRL